MLRNRRIPKPPHWHAARARWACLALAAIGLAGGAEHFTQAAPTDIVINEILYHPDAANLGDEFLELYNRGTTPVDVSGWVLTTAVNFTFPAGTVMPAGSFLVVARDAAAARSFYHITNVVGSYTGKLDNAGETINLWDNGTPRALIDTVAYDDAPPWPTEADGGGASLELFLADSDNADPRNWGIGQPYSPGRANAPTAAGGGSIVINEIMYRPLREEFRQKFDAVNQGTYYEQGDDELGEYVELFNRGTNTVDLGGWAFTDGVAFVFSNGVTLAPGGYLVVAAKPEALRARFAITNVAGPFIGVLSDGGERLTLRDANGGVMDTLKYEDTHPWPEAPDEFGYSLECINPYRDHSTPANWRACQASSQSFHQQWQNLSVTNTAGSDDFFLHLNGAGEWLIEDVEVRPVAGGANLLPNGSFEPDDTGWAKLGNHAASQRTNGIAYTGSGCLWLVASGPGDAVTNHVRFANVPGIVLGQRYTVSCRASWLRGNGAVSFGWLASGTGTVAQTQLSLSSLAAEWSDSNNPSGSWSYRQRSGALITTHLAAWLPGDLGANQPAWTDAGSGGVPGWARSTGSSSAGGAPHPEYDFPVGKVMAHGPAEAWWTSSASQRVTIAGGVWLLRHIGRDQRWYVKLNDAFLTSGTILSAETGVSSQAPRDLTSGTNSAALALDLQPGDILKFGSAPLAPNTIEDFVGFDLRIVSGTAASPTNQLPHITGFIGKGTPGRANSVCASNLPPLVEELRHFPEQPRSTNSVTVTARIRSDFPLTSLRLETVRNLETNATFLDMFDDGLHGDLAANDGVYGVIVPAQPSQTLVHYRVHATDSQGSQTIFPYPDDPSPTQAYFHYDDEINTQLALFHLFISSDNLAQLDANPYSDDYVDCSLAIDHVAYPHIRARYRGRRSRVDPKHPWKFQFNKSQLYQTNRTYDLMFSIPLEQEVAFETFDRAGIDNLEHELIRMHLNGSFWGVYIGFESPTGSWLGKHGHDGAGELYKARSVETANQSKNSDLFHNDIVTDLDYWGAYNKKVRPLETPDSLRALVDAVNDLPDDKLLPWLDEHVDLDQWLKRWALLVCMNIDDFCGHNHYHFLPGEPGGKWRWLGYDFDSGFTFERVGPLRAFYGDGNHGDSPDWQRNKLCARVSANATLRRIYLLTLRHLLNEVIREDVIFPRLDELFTLMTPDRQADLARWSTLRTSTTEAKSVLSSQKLSLSNYLAAAGLPSADKIPELSAAGGPIATGSALQLAAAPGWKIYFTTDGSDPRLSLSRRAYTGPITLTNSGVVSAAAIPESESLAAGDWTDLAMEAFVVLPRPQLSALRNGTGLKLTWPAAFTNQVLESATGPTGTWSEVLATPTLVDDHFEVDQTTASSTCFYRLRGQ